MFSHLLLIILLGMFVYVFLDMQLIWGNLSKRKYGHLLAFSRHGLVTLQNEAAAYIPTGKEEEEAVPPPPHLLPWDFHNLCFNCYPLSFSFVKLTAFFFCLYLSKLILIKTICIEHGENFRAEKHTQQRMGTVSTYDSIPRFSFLEGWKLSLMCPSRDTLCIDKHICTACVLTDTCKK